MRQIAQVVLEGGKAGDDLALHAECRQPIRDALLGVGDDFQNRLPQLLKRAALGLLQPFQIGVDLVC